MYSIALSGGRSAHGDWWNGWQQSGGEDFLNTITENCVKARRDCKAHLLGDGRTLY
jgi:hypothetical protein